MQAQSGQVPGDTTRFDLRRIGLAAVVSVLLLVIAFAVQREMRAKPQLPAALPMTERAVDRPAMTAPEEAYAAALWAVHSEVKLHAVRMTFTGLSYKMGDIKTAELAARVAPLSASFRAARERARTIAPPPSLQPVHERYLAALQRYEQAAATMTQAASDPAAARDQRLLKAQGLSQQASEDLLRVSDVLWPGEHKPN
jgi:hypothetical protein